MRPYREDASSREKAKKQRRPLDSLFARVSHAHHPTSTERERERGKKKNDEVLGFQFESLNLG